MKLFHVMKRHRTDLSTLTLWFEGSTSDFRTLRWTSSPMAMYHMRGWSFSTLVANIICKYFKEIFGLKTSQNTTINTYKLQVHDHLLLEPCWWVPFGMRDAYKNRYAEVSLKGWNHSRHIKALSNHIIYYILILVHIYLCGAILWESLGDDWIQYSTALYQVLPDRLASQWCCVPKMETFSKNPCDFMAGCCSCHWGQMLGDELSFYLAIGPLGQFLSRESLQFSGMVYDCRKRWTSIVSRLRK